MNSAKQQVREILDDLPDDASFEEIQYHIYARQKIRRGLDDIAAGRVVDHQNVKASMAIWIEKSGGRGQP